MAKVAFVPAAGDHVRAVGALMRERDRHEVYLASGLAPRAALERSVGMSRHAWCCKVDGRPGCLFGVTPAPFGGVPWLLGTDRLVLAGLALATAPAPFLAQWRAEFGVLRNMVWAGNNVSIRWLRHLGFEIGPAERWGLHQGLFHPFEMRADNV